MYRSLKIMNAPNFLISLACFPTKYWRCINMDNNCRSSLKCAWSVVVAANDGQSVWLLEDLGLQQWSYRVFTRSQWENNGLNGPQFTVCSWNFPSCHPKSPRDGEMAVLQCGEAGTNNRLVARSSIIFPSVDSPTLCLCWWSWYGSRHVGFALDHS